MTWLMKFVQKYQLTKEMQMLIKPIEQEECFVKAGIYKAELIHVGSHHNGIEERINFQFSIDGGDYEGAIISRATKQQWTPGSKLAQTVSGVLGRSIKSEEFKREFDLDGIVGRKCYLWVTEETDRHGTPYPSINQVMYQN